MSTKRKTFLLVALLGLALSQPALAVQNDENDVSSIRRVVELFCTSIINRDKATFTGLFFSEDPERVTWQFVVDDARLARLHKTKPEAKKARYIPQSNYLGFIDAVVSSKTSSEEVLSNVKIETDGEVASVDFDYSYRADGRQTNWGREMWQLIRTEDGWRIISVVWSIHDPREPRQS